MKLSPSVAIARTQSRDSNYFSQPIQTPGKPQSAFFSNNPRISPPSAQNQDISPHQPPLLHQPSFFSSAPSAVPSQTYRGRSMTPSGSMAPRNLYASQQSAYTNTGANSTSAYSSQPAMSVIPPSSVGSSYTTATGMNGGGRASRLTHQPYDQWVRSCPCGRCRGNTKYVHASDATSISG